MAIRIPTQDAPRVASTPRPTPFENTNPPQSGLAGGLALTSQALGDSAKIMQKAKGEADAQAYLEAQNEFRAFTDAGFRALRNAEGRNAAEAANKFYEEADKRSKQIFGKLSNNEQQTMFTNWANGELEQSHKIGEAYVSDQIKAADIQEFNGANANGLTRSGNAIHVPGVAETEVGNIEKRIFGEDVNGIHVPGFADRRGMSKDAADALRNKLVGELYSDKATRLLDLGELQAAEAVVQAHTKELGEHGKELLGHIAEKARLARADTMAGELAKTFQLRDGNIDTLKAEAVIDQKTAPGPERLAAKAALFHEAERVHHGVEAQQHATWDGALGDYMKTRSYWEVQRSSPFFKDLTSQQRENLYQKFLADKREREGLPMTPLQLDAYGDLTFDIAARSEFWGTAEMRALESDRRFAMLPDKEQKAVTDMVRGAHQDRSNLSTQFNAVEKVALERAQSPGHPLDGTAGKKHDQLDDSQRESWRQIRDGVRSRLAEWKDQNPKAAFIPDAVVQQAVDDTTRQATVKEGRWYWLFLGGTKDVPLRDAVRDRRNIVAPVVNGDEETIGRDVLRRQGWKPDEMTPAKIIEAARASRMIESVIPPQDYERLRKFLQSRNRTPTDDAIRTVWKAEQLHFQQD